MYCKNCEKDIELGPDGQWRLVSTQARICGQTTEGFIWHEPPENAYFYVPKNKPIRVRIHPPKTASTTLTRSEVIEIVAQNILAYVPAADPNGETAQLVRRIASDTRFLKTRDDLWWQSCLEMYGFVKR